MLLPCSSNVDMQMIGFPSRLSSPLLYVVAGFILFLAVRFVLQRHTKNSSPLVAHKEKTTAQQIKLDDQKSTSSSLWRLFTWETLPVSLPMSLTASSKPTVIGRGVGVSPSRSSTPGSPSESDQLVTWQRRGPSFEQPLPAIYQSQEPLSMAKLIMSRHTFRRPTPKPSKRSVSAPPTPSRPQLTV